MNKSLIKFIADFSPLLIFFLVYYNNDKNIIAAIPPLILATLIGVAVVYYIEKKLPYIPLVGAFLISIFGGLTVFFDNPIFIYLKPTIINLIFASVLLFGKLLLKKNFLKIFFGSSMKLTDQGWDKLNYRWIYFFVFLAFLNEYVWRTHAEEVWINFKVWGILPLTFIFTAFQVPLIKKYKLND